jgi:signal-transduction protein with cAMP-binding, CBS, and nucleotidyltransferase domain
MVTGYKVGEFMSREVMTLPSDALIMDCAVKMSEERIGCLVIKKDGKIEGIVTEQDLARKVMAKGVNPGEIKVEEIMNKKIISIEPEKDLYDAVLLMGNNEIKHLPVISKGKLMGIITSKDIIQIEPSLIELLKFNNFKRRKK